MNTVSTRSANTSRFTSGPLLWLTVIALVHLIYNVSGVFFLLPGLVFSTEAVLLKPRDDVSALMANSAQLEELDIRQ